MKSVLFLVALSWLLVGCGPPSDQKVRRNLSGIWYAGITNASGGTFRSVIVISPDGRYTSQSATSQIGPNQAQVIRLEGNYRVKDGFLIDTVTKNSQPKAVVPHVMRARIVRANERELVVRYEGAPGVSILRKDTTSGLVPAPLKQGSPTNLLIK